ncbi:MAG: PTS system mannose/fructose/N-acetylgalactosamine-transporter subunit IIB [Candidatus Njordarchaeales archaeon]
MIILRVDDRFIHGQVTVSWVRTYKIKEIWVVSDEIANDELLSTIQKSSAPPGVNVKILRLREAIEELNKNSPRDRTLIIVGSPIDALEIVKAGLRIDKVVLGQMSFKEGRIRIERTISVGIEDARALKELSELGIRIIYQQTAADKPKEVKIEEIMARFH